MKIDFICPHCNGYLNVKESLILTAVNKHNSAGLVFIDVRLGVYKAQMHPTLQFSDGEHVDFRCPVCAHSLGVPKFDKRLCALYMRDDNDWQSTIVFSSIYGEKCTYKITEKTVEAFGDDNYGKLDFTSISEYMF
ncbi:hypothetical protein EMN47_04325 [Prolixibacteraceae bacterium JC049]|nr:hypothetical protein [Prolixibacteraceae bacterium JC049]